MQSGSRALDGAECDLFKSRAGNSPSTHSGVTSEFSFFLLSLNYLPVDRGVINQLVKLLLDGQLEGACLVSLLSILAS